jgi:hypothetical protein
MFAYQTATDLRQAVLDLDEEAGEEEEWCVEWCNTTPDPLWLHPNCAVRGQFLWLHEGSGPWPTWYADAQEDFGWGDDDFQAGTTLEAQGMTAVNASPPDYTTAKSKFEDANEKYSDACDHYDTALTLLEWVWDGGYWTPTSEFTPGLNQFKGAMQGATTAHYYEWPGCSCTEVPWW